MGIDMMAMNCSLSGRLDADELKEKTKPHGILAAWQPTRMDK